MEENHVILHTGFKLNSFTEITEEPLRFVIVSTFR